MFRAENKVGKTAVPSAVTADGTHHLHPSCKAKVHVPKKTDPSWGGAES